MSNLELKGFKGLRNINELTNNIATNTIFSEKIEYISLDKIKPGRYQPRQVIDTEGLEELASSIKAQGIIQPLILREIEKEEYEIIAGERRWRAAKIAKLDHVPAIIKQIDDNIALAFALIENIQREDLNPVDEAIAFSRFRDEFKMTHTEIAETVGRSRVTITNTLRLLSLSESIKEFIKTGQINMGHARALLTLESDQQLLLVKKIIESNLNVRSTEKIAQEMKLSTSQNINCKLLQGNDPYKERYKHWSTTLSRRLSNKVSVKLNRKGKGRVVIHVESPEEIDWLLEHLKVE